MSIRRLALAFFCLGLVSAGIVLNWPTSGKPNAVVNRVDFSRDIRPILNQNCTSCHGGVRQKNGVSFIYREEALGIGKSGRRTIVPGHPNKSELIARLLSTDPEARMPYHAPPLPAKEIALLRQWIKEGAQWEDHWAFVAPKPQPLPVVRNTIWPTQPLDRFILAGLEKEGLNPAPEADKAELLRRVSFDLVGLPPTPEELSAFLADTSPNAYEKQVDRLLASAHYGERWAALWLDLARYADSRGYEKDRNRPMWPYRDWVIDAFNRNLPYDRFVITQLAGDLLPNASFEDRIATSFQRLTPVNDENGSDDEEFRLVAAMDRVATTWSVLNGLTMNCVQCHSHPYDPFHHVEYYKFLAFYNTSRDADLYDDSPTLSVAKNPSQRSDAFHWQERRAHLLAEIVVQGRDLAESTAWSELPIKTGAVNAALGLERSIEKIKQDQLKGTNPDPESITAKELKKYYRDAIKQANAELARARTAVHAVAISIDQGEAETVGTVPEQSVLELESEVAPVQVNALRIQVPPKNPDTVSHTPEDGFIVDRVDAWVVSANGAEQKIDFRYCVQDSTENLENAVRPVAPTTCGFGANSKLFRTRWLIGIPNKGLVLKPGSRIKVQLTQSGELGGKPASVGRVRLQTSFDERWMAFGGNQALSIKLQELGDLERRLAGIQSVPLPVMVEESSYERRQTLEFERGNFLTKIGPVLNPDVPALFPELPQGAPRTRLTMAKWFFAPRQPLTARVAVNRYWEQLFGTGIVETLEDFGSAGQPPSHPQLLDWLALHFQNELRWDMKALLRELVTSATYRQSAETPSTILEKDPRNRLLSHGPQQRLTAEMVRDQALLASGLLTPVIGGPSVMPPQPAGIWMTVYNKSKWINAKGPDRYRRAIYTFLKRAAIYPSLVTFDASDHAVSLPRRISTNTPLQALVTLNDPVYHEAADALAQRMMALAAKGDFATTLEARLNYGARCVLSRDLSSKELATLEAFYRDAKHMNTGASKPENVPALNAIAAVLLNLDAALTR